MSITIVSSARNCHISQDKRNRQTQQATKAAGNPGCWQLLTNEGQEYHSSSNMFHQMKLVASFLHKSQGRKLEREGNRCNILLTFILCSLDDLVRKKDCLLSKKALNCDSYDFSDSRRFTFQAVYCISSLTPPVGRSVPQPIFLIITTLKPTFCEETDTFCVNSKKLLISFPQKMVSPNTKEKAIHVWIYFHYHPAK